MILPCISIRNPWAWAVAAGKKPWENRPQHRNYRGPLLIHAGLTPAADYQDAVALIERLGRSPVPQSLDRGGIVGAAFLDDCAPPLQRDDGWRFAGQYGLLLTCAITLPFRPYKGALGLFKVELTPDEESALRAAGLLPA